MRRAIRTSSIILANLVIGENVVPEFVQEDCTPEKLLEPLREILTDSPLRRRQTEGFRRTGRDHVDRRPAAERARRRYRAGDDAESPATELASNNQKAGRCDRIRLSRRSPCIVEAYLRLPIST